MQTKMFYLYFVYICKTHSHWNKYNTMTHLQVHYLYFVYICKTHSHWNKYNTMTHLQVLFCTAEFSANFKPNLKCVLLG